MRKHHGVPPAIEKSDIWVSEQDEEKEEEDIGNYDYDEGSVENKLQNIFKRKGRPEISKNKCVKDNNPGEEVKKLVHKKGRPKGSINRIARKIDGKSGESQEKNVKRKRRPKGHSRNISESESSVWYTNEDCEENKSNRSVLKTNCKEQANPSKIPQKHPRSVLNPLRHVKSEEIGSTSPERSNSELVSDTNKAITGISVEKTVQEDVHEVIEIQDSEGENAVLESRTSRSGRRLFKRNVYNGYVSYNPWQKVNSKIPVEKTDTHDIPLRIRRDVLFKRNHTKRRDSKACVSFDVSKSQVGDDEDTSDVEISVVDTDDETLMHGIRTSRSGRVLKPKVYDFMPGFRKSRGKRRKLMKIYEDDTEGRLTHNNLERKRRMELRACFEMLRTVIPETMNYEKAPKISILDYGAKYIKELNENEQKWIHVKKNLMKNQAILRQRVDELRKFKKRKRHR